MPHVKTSDKQFVRDVDSNALLNTDKAALERHRKQRAAAHRAAGLQQCVDDLSRRVTRLEELLLKSIDDGR